MLNKLSRKRNLRLEIQYAGANYCGWQIQKHKDTRSQRHRSIQETIEKALRRILRERVRTIVSGRTDSGVHAAGQVVNFFTRCVIPVDKLRLALNDILPADISVSQVEVAPEKFHSRFSAKSKVYRYTILNRKFPNALIGNFACFYPQPLDLARMRKAASFLLGKHDFKSFCASGSKVKDTVRSIKRLTIKISGLSSGLLENKEKQKPLIIIEIEGDGFLYNMVRNIVGTLIEIGAGKRRPEEIKDILESRNRQRAGKTAPAKGLMLYKVEY